MSERVTCIMVSEYCTLRESDTFGSFIAQDHPNTELVIVHKSRYPVVVPVCVNRNVRVLTAKLKLDNDETIDHALEHIHGGSVCIIRPGTVMLPWHLSSMLRLMRTSCALAACTTRTWLYGDGRYGLGNHGSLDLWIFDTEWARRIGFTRTKGHATGQAPIKEFAESTGALCVYDNHADSSLIVRRDGHPFDETDAVHRVLRPNDPEVWYRSLLGQMDEGLDVRSSLARRLGTCPRKSF